MSISNRPKLLSRTLISIPVTVYERIINLFNEDSSGIAYFIRGVGIYSAKRIIIVSCRNLSLCELRNRLTHRTTTIGLSIAA